MLEEQRGQRLQAALGVSGSRWEGTAQAVGSPSAPVLAAREHTWARYGCGEVPVFAFPGVSLLYVCLEMSGETQNHLSQVPNPQQRPGQEGGGDRAELPP